MEESVRFLPLLSDYRRTNNATNLGKRRKTESTSSAEHIDSENAVVESISPVPLMSRRQLVFISSDGKEKAKKDK